MSIFRAHPGICESEPPAPDACRSALTYGKLDWSDAQIAMSDRLAWERRHAPTLERQLYALPHDNRTSSTGPR